METGVAMQACNNCKNPAPYAKVIRETVEWCDRCGIGALTSIPDVYFKEPYVDEHLGNEAHPGPKRINTRAEKAYWLKTCGLREAGDRVHGATSFDPISYRHAQESLRRK
jgi:hypothetical protein